MRGLLSVNFIKREKNYFPVTFQLKFCPDLSIRATFWRPFKILDFDACLCQLKWTKLIILIKCNITKHWYPNTEKRELKIRRSAEYFWRNSRCLDTVQPMTHCLECLISLLNQNYNYRVNGEITPSKSMLIKTGFPNFTRGYDFLVLTW